MSAIRRSDLVWQCGVWLREEMDQGQEKLLRGSDD